MPDIFFLIHPLGSVVGNGIDDDYLVIYQNCTIGSTADHYPTFGNDVVLYTGSSVIGKCNVGSDVVFGANSFIINTDVPSHSVVVGAHPNIRLTHNRVSVGQRCFESSDLSGKEIS